MKTRLNILCILLLAAFIGLCYNGFQGGLNNVRNGHSGDLRHDHKSLYSVKVIPLEGNRLKDSIANAASQEEFLKYQLESIRVEKSPNSSADLLERIMSILFFPLTLMIFASCYFFIRLIWSIRKKDIFNPVHVLRVRFISITIVLISIMRILKEYLDYYVATQTIRLPGYEVKEHSIYWGTFVVALLLAVFAEIYAQAIKVKEEQDLTI